MEARDRTEPHAMLREQLDGGEPEGEALLIDGADGAPSPWPEAAAAVRWAPTEVDRRLHDPSRFAVGVVIDSLDGLDDAAADALLAALRDRLCRRVLVLVPADTRFDRVRMLAMGYTLRGRGAGGWCLYDHDIASYNPERSWNNPSDWAHPENFDRYRW